MPMCPSFQRFRPRGRALSRRVQWWLTRSRRSSTSVAPAASSSQSRVGRWLSPSRSPRDKARPRAAPTRAWLPTPPRRRQPRDVGDAVTAECSVIPRHREIRLPPHAGSADSCSSRALTAALTTDRRQSDRWLGLPPNVERSRAGPQRGAATSRLYGSGRLGYPSSREGAGKARVPLRRPSRSGTAGELRFLTGGRGRIGEGADDQPLLRDRDRDVFR